MIFRKPIVVHFVKVFLKIIRKALQQKAVKVTADT